MPANRNDLWAPEKEQMLRDCIAKKMSAGKTADFMGITAGAANGKAHRLGLKFLSIAGHNRKPRGGKREPRNGWSRKSAISIITNLTRDDPGEAALPVQTTPPEFLGLTLFELGENECHYIAGNDRLYCGQPTDGNSPYCKFCQTIIYNPHVIRSGRLNFPPMNGRR